MGNPVMHFEIIGKDGMALSTFYGEAFGWEMQPAMQEPMVYVLVHPGGEGGSRAALAARPKRAGGMSPFTSRSRIPRPRWPPSRSWVAGP